MGLWHPPAVLLKQVCVFGRHFYTHRRGACTQIYISVSYVAVFLWTDPVSHWSEWRWVKPTSLLMGVPICMSMSLFWSRLLFSADCSLFPFSFCIFQCENTAYTLPLWGVPCYTRNTSLSVLYVALAPEEANRKHWGLMVLSTLLGSPLDQPHKLCSLFLLSTLSPVCITLAPALQR